MVDIGGGAGYFTEAFVDAGARCLLVEPEAGAPDDPTIAPRPRAPVVCRSKTPPKPPDVNATAVAVSAGAPRPGPDHRRRRQPAPVPRRHRRRGLLLQRPRARPRSGPVPRRDGPGHPPRRHHLPVLHGVVLAVGGPRDRALALSRRPPGRGRYERRHGRPPGNRFGSSLFACHVGPTLRMARAHRGVEVVAALPRYYPDWMRWLIEVPAVRELATWNLLLVLRRRSAIT